MAIVDYASLKTDALDWLGHTVNGSSARVDNYIDNTEAWFNRNVRVRQQETTSTTLTISAAGVVSHPADWLAWKEIKLTTPPIQHLNVYTQESSHLRNESGATARPRGALVRGDATYLLPIPADTYTYSFVYYAKLPALTGSATTNWLVLAHPDIYLFGVLWQANMLGMNAERAGYWKGLFEDNIDQLRLSAWKDGHSGGTLTPRPRNVV